MYIIASLREMLRGRILHRTFRASSIPVWVGSCGFFHPPFFDIFLQAPGFFFLQITDYFCFIYFTHAKSLTFPLQLLARLSTVERGRGG
jgi:hypothetical protein